MLELREKLQGKFNLETRLLAEEEKKYYGIFISHSSKDNDKYLFPLREAMLKKEIYPLCDRDFLEGGDEFQEKIETALDCYAAVIIITENSLVSDWVNYEIGYLTGLGKTILIYDPENLFTHENRKNNPQISTLYNQHFKNVGAVYHTLDELITAISAETPYSDMFCEENDFLTVNEFYERIDKRLVSVIVTLESAVFGEHYDDFKNCRFAVLIPNFGMFYEDHGDGMHCYARRSAELKNGLCPTSGMPCALVGRSEMTDENKECVILNYQTFSGVIRKKGEPDRRGVIMKEYCIEFCMPLHKYFGTEFKFIIECDDNNSYNRILSALNEAGMNPSASMSVIGGKIYLSLPERRGQGLFRLNHEFSNNFLCPSVLK